MILERRSDARGHVRAGSIESRHAFSSGEYYDPRWMGFGALRVLSEVALDPGASLPLQRHANMELLTYVLSGALEHRHGAAATAPLLSGELLWVGAGHGIEHAFGNASADQPVRYLQAWIQPDRLNARPACARHAVDASQRRGRWATLASPDGAEGSPPMHQQAWLRGALLGGDDAIGLALDPARRYWLHAAEGRVRVNGSALAAGDALGFADEATTLRITAVGEGVADVLLFDLPA